MEDLFDNGEDDIQCASYSSKYPEGKHQIRNRYKDTSQQIYKEQSASYKSSLLSIGGDRTSLVSSYGNTPTFMRRSMSSGGVLSYSYEQMSFKKNNAHILPSLENDLKEADINSSKPIDETESSDILCDDYQNPKIFQQYDLPRNLQLSNNGLPSDKSRSSNSQVFSSELGTEHISFPKVNISQSPKTYGANGDMTEIIKRLQRSIDSIPEGKLMPENIATRFPNIQSACNSATLTEEKFGSISLTSTGSIENSLSYNIDSSGNYLYQRNSLQVNSNISKPHQKIPPKNPESDHRLSPKTKPPIPSKPVKDDLIVTSFALRKIPSDNDTHLFGYQRTGSKLSSYLWYKHSEKKELKPLEKTVGENLHTTQTIIKSFAYVDSEVTCVTSPHNTSRLCALM